MRSLVVAAAMFIASPALADDYSYAVDGILKDIYSGRWSEEEPPTPQGQKVFVSLPGMGETLDALQERLGGVITMAADGEPIDGYLCYRDGGIRVFYLARDEVVDWIVAEPANPTTDAVYHCVDQPSARAQFATGFPALGATTADVAAWYNQSLAQIAPYQAFFLEETLANGSRNHTVHYRFTEGVVDGISIDYAEFE